MSHPPDTLLSLLEEYHPIEGFDYAKTIHAILGVWYAVSGDGPRPTLAQLQSLILVNVGIRLEAGMIAWIVNMLPNRVVLKDGKVGEL